MHAVHDRINSLHAAAEAERLARRRRSETDRVNRAGTIRRRAGHALIALGTLLEGRSDEGDRGHERVIA